MPIFSSDVDARWTITRGATYPPFEFNAFERGRKNLADRIASGLLFIYKDGVERRANLPLAVVTTPQLDSDLQVPFLRHTWQVGETDLPRGVYQARARVVLSSGETAYVPSDGFYEIEVID
jgi:hypothetical protein